MAPTPMFTGVQSIGRVTALVGAHHVRRALWDPAPSFEAARTGRGARAAQIKTVRACGLGTGRCKKVTRA